MDFSKRTRLLELFQTGKDGQQLAVGGWVRTKRVSKHVAFVVISDGSTQDTLQVVIDASSRAFLHMDQVATGASCWFEGTLKTSPAKGQAFELHCSAMTILGEASEHYPLQKKGHTLEFLREIGHLRPRTNTFGALFRVRNAAAKAIHDFFQSKGFVWAHTPILTASDCEGAGELFQVTTLDLENPPRDPATKKIDFSQDFFGKASHLTVSGQLQGEFMALALGDIYTFGPTFRAENSNTTRHLSEFWMVEPEMAFADLSSVMALAEDFVKSVISQVMESCEKELEFFETHYKETSIERLKKIVSSKFVRISYTEAVELLQKSGNSFEHSVSWGADLQTEHERFLTEQIFKCPVIVYNYPSAIKAFYMRESDDQKTVAAMDLLVPGVGELIGGSQREERLDVLIKRMEMFDINPQDLDWYLDLRRYGSTPHGGFGLGFERLIMYLTGLSNIRDAIMCPRAPKSIDF